jgi:excinuclease ABC subunit A
LSFLKNVGLSYLSLNRPGPTLSGGESQRIRLASQLGSELTGVLYILDEPSIGLHPRDNRKLIETLLHLRDLGNSVLVVEHDQEMMEYADWIVDFGLGAGRLGGEVIAQGKYPQLIEDPKSLTAAYLSGRKKIEIPKRRPNDPNRQLKIVKANANNIKSLDVSFPVGLFTCVTGVSGAGKSTLIGQILEPAAAHRLNGADLKSSIPCEKIEGFEFFDKVVNIDQSPIGRTPRSNPATYTKAWDEIREIFAQLPESKSYGFKAGRFSFNIAGGRCDACDGNGMVKVEMHFLADVYVPCDVCLGKRFNEATLRVKYKDLNIADVLNTPIEEISRTFSAYPKLKAILKTLEDVGVGYLNLGQPSTTLSGGEAQRIKLSRELSKRATGKTLYILDEPSTGLHFEDVHRLLEVIQRLVDQGNTVIMIEHNLDVIKTADWIIDLGPEGGDLGGKLMAKGTPEDVAKVQKSDTGRFLKEILKTVKN